MDKDSVGSMSLSQIIERKLSFLLNNDISPWDGDNPDKGERDALQSMLSDSKELTEEQFESKYKTELAKLKDRFENKEYSVEDDDDYYESFNNTLVSILELINPVNLYDLSDD